MRSNTGSSGEITNIDVLQLYRWVNVFALDAQGDEERFSSFHFPAWLDLGELSQWFDGYQIVDFERLTQLPLFYVW